MKTLFYDGKVYLGNNCFATGFVIENEKFSQIIFNDKDVDFKLYDKVINLNKKVVISSFIDNHTHLMLAINDKKSNCMNIKNISDLNNKISKNNNKNYYYGLKFNISKQEIDKINNNLPIFISSFDHHNLYLNSQAIDLALKNSIKLNEYEIKYGIFNENHCFKIWPLIFKINEKSIIKNLLKTCKKIEKMGIATISSCDLTIQNFETQINIYKAILDQINFDLKFQCVVKSLSELNEMISKIKSHNLTCNNSQIKIILDGSLSSQSAYMSLPYKDSNNFGIINFTKSEILELINISNENDLQVVFHCIGDKSIENVIWAIKKAKNKSIKNIILHAQFLNETILEFLKSSNLLFSVQPIFIKEDINLIEKYVDDSLIKYSYLFKTIYSINNSSLSFSSDFPICDFNPFENIYWAINNNFNDQNFLIYQAIDCYTKNAAKMLRIDNEYGQIAKNYFANFLVLSDDIFEIKNKIDIKNISILSSYRKGKRIF